MMAEEKDLGLGIFLPAITEHKPYFKIQILFGVPTFLKKMQKFRHSIFFLLLQNRP